MSAINFRNKLTEMLSKIPGIRGIGQTGDINAPLVPGKSDIDMFVICDKVPEREERLKFYESLTGSYDSLQMEVCAGGIWGYGDIFMCEGIDVMPMYFTVTEMKNYLEEVIAGKHLEKDGRFYPVGRLASIETLNVLWEKDFAWTNIINLVKNHPVDFFQAWFKNESWRILDEEDLGRAELRHEVLFFHQVVEEFLDHFLQALYALNNQYFPSRKRTQKAIEGFKLKPENCYQRLNDIVSLSVSEEHITEAVYEIRKLGKELLDMA